MSQFEHAGEDYTATVPLAVSGCLYEAFVWLHQVNEKADLFGISFTAPPHLCCCLKKTHDIKMP